MKYILTDETKEIYGRTLHRIQRIEDNFLGGWIESESNLSQDGECWVYGNAYVSGNAEVSDDAKVYDNALVSGNARVYGDAEVFGNAAVSGNAKVYGNTQVCGDARVCGDALVSGNAKVYGNTQVYEDCWVFGNAYVYDEAKVSGNAKVSGSAEVFGNAKASTTPLTAHAGRSHNITVTDKHVAVGCEIHTHKYWLKNIQEIGEKHDYSPEDIETYRSIIENLVNRKKRELK